MTARSDCGGACHKRGAVWAVLRAAAILDHEIEDRGNESGGMSRGHRSIGPRYFTACVACMLREAGYRPPEREDYGRRVRPMRDKIRRRQRAVLFTPA